MAAPAMVCYVPEQLAGAALAPLLVAAQGAQQSLQVVAAPAASPEAAEPAADA